MVHFYEQQFHQYLQGVRLKCNQNINIQVHFNTTVGITAFRRGAFLIVVNFTPCFAPFYNKPPYNTWSYLLLIRCIFDNSGFYTLFKGKTHYKYARNIEISSFIKWCKNKILTLLSLQNFILLKFVILCQLCKNTFGVEQLRVKFVKIMFNPIPNMFFSFP